MTIPQDIRSAQRVAVCPVMRDTAIHEWNKDTVRIYGMEVCLIQASRYDDVYEVAVFRYQDDTAPILRVSIKDIRRLLYKWEIIASPQGAQKIKRAEIYEDD